MAPANIRLSCRGTVHTLSTSMEKCMSLGVPRAQARVITADVSVWSRMAELWRSRELLVRMVRTELKIKYKNSFLGFVWSMLNPALYLVVYYVVFAVILGSDIVRFPIFLLSGLLVWNLFSTGLGGAVASVTGQGGLVKKVSFPRAILPLASVGASLTHFFLQSIVLVSALVIFRQGIGWEYVWLLPIALAVLLVLTSALGIFLAAANVGLRDTQHFLELALLAWFWVTPIVYPYALVSSHDNLFSTLYNLNPLVSIVLTFQRALYNISSTASGAPIIPDAGPLWFLSRLVIVGVASCVLFVFALSYFGRVEGSFAEEL